MASHLEREEIARRCLKFRPSLYRQALARRSCRPRRETTRRPPADRARMCWRSP